MHYSTAEEGRFAPVRELSIVDSVDLPLSTYRPPIHIDHPFQSKIPKTGTQQNPPTNTTTTKTTTTTSTNKETESDFSKLTRDVFSPTAKLDTIEDTGKKASKFLEVSEKTLEKTIGKGETEELWLMGPAEAKANIDIVLDVLHKLKPMRDFVRRRESRSLHHFHF